MKYLITESKLEKVIFKYLDNQDFIQIEKGNRIYFVNSEGDEYAQILYNKKNGEGIIRHELIEEISSFFSLRDYKSEQYIGKWINKTLQMRVTSTHLSWISHTTRLRIPRN
jgi:hypothetical protein